MYCVVGLGNPGNSYSKTRHNIGWMVVNTFCERGNFSAAESLKPHQAVVRRGTHEEQDVWAVYPQTYMNRSGETVRSLWREIPEAEVVVVHDDVDLPLGELRISYGRGHGGHNGIRSIFEHCKTKDFVRVRMGVASREWFSGDIRRPSGGAALQTHVLGRFSFLEQSMLKRAREHGAAALQAIIAEGYTAAMNTYNAQSS